MIRNDLAVLFFGPESEGQEKVALGFGVVIGSLGDYFVDKIGDGVGGNSVNTNIAR